KIPTGARLRPWHNTPPWVANPAMQALAKGWPLKISLQERLNRASLPLIRFFQTSLPPSVANRLIRAGLAGVRLGPGVRRQAITADGVPCEWLIPENHQADRALLYLHGGGFVFGLTPPHLLLGASLARRLGLRVLMVDYRLAPQHPFPAALDDCARAYHWLLGQGIAAQQVVVAGDSAGGNLTLTLLLKLRAAGESLPAAAACLSPVADLTPTEAPPAGLKDPLLPTKVMNFYKRSYIGAGDPRDPLISPAFGSLHGLPPLLLHVGEKEVLRADAVRIADLARSAGVEVQLEIYARMWHVWQINLALPQASHSLDQIAHFFEAHLPGTSPASMNDMKIPK
ncbi:MAG: alpha/beta hydrolase, partial [Anaerolineales bacterium]|nr:alpha/beta hydrolase [Anaerolineales bacterium]